ncbi:cytochrome b/b6 domain-containing protein [Streptomyces sp. NPDC028635]|uniref:cytochrome b/b6 domain-containing protein n=1 Tax=Streptomyces sp. NPDC028635 TaxID=3154800 RepID=UPI0033CC1653
MNRRRSTPSLPRPGRSAYGVASAVVLLLIPLIVLVGGDRVRDFLNFGAGVLSLVSLSCSVIWGLVAQDRILLNTRQRIVGQAVHRTTAVASIAFLLLHITTKLALDHTVLIAAVIPFSLGLTGSAGLIGLGSAAGLLMIFVGVTGALRSRFASPAPVAARWRAMHMLAYPAWCAALVHGLYAGRSAKPLFVFLYGLALLGVIAALALRAAPRPVKRRFADTVAALLGTEERGGREELEASRTRAAEQEGRTPAAGSAAALPGYDIPRRRTGSAPDAAAFDPPSPEPARGFAAAYRAVSARTRATQPFTTDQSYATGRTADPAYATGQTFAADQPFATDPSYATGQGVAADHAFATDETLIAGASYAGDRTGRTDVPSYARVDLPPDPQPTQAMPRMDGGSGPAGGWPIPSPPPVGEAPPSAYDPLRDTGYTVPAYGGADSAGYGGRDPYDTGETNPLAGAYPSNDMYTSGPATETLPGASFDAPGSGEPWNTPSGGYR